MILPLRRLIGDLKPDVVFGLYLSSAGLLACLSGHRRVVVSARGGDVNSHINSFLWRRLFRWMGRRAKLVHCVSDSLSEQLCTRAGVPPRKLITAPIGVDCSRFTLAEFAQRPGGGMLLCTRAHKPVYDNATLLRGMRILKDMGENFHLTFVEAPRADETRAVVGALDLDDRVSFIDPYALGELPGILAQHDIYVSASLSDGASSSLLEAMSSGICPVVSDIEANHPWVEHGDNGLLFPPGDAEALAECLLKAIRNSEFRRLAGQKSHAIVNERANREQQTDVLLQSLQRVVQEG
jgi:glycosyltransferase involved in cell wall biosynthesis